MPEIRARDRFPVHYRILGRGKPVVMLHGVGMDSRHWLPFILLHAHRYRFYLPDFRGAGKACAVPVNQADLFNNLAEDIQDLINALKLDRFHLVGYSLGASIAMQLQQMGEFDKVDRYLHIDQSPAIANRDDWQHGLLGPEQAAFLNLLEELHQHLRPYRHSQSVLELPETVKKAAIPLITQVLSVAAGTPSVVMVLRQAARAPQLLSRLLGRITVHNILMYIQTYANNLHDYRDSMSRCQVPVTMFIGRQSPLYSYEGQRAVARLIPQCRVVSFDKSGHMPQMDEPFKFAHQLGRFLKR